MKRITIMIASLLLIVGIAQAQEDATSMDALLQQIQQGQARDSTEAGGHSTTAARGDHAAVEDYLQSDQAWAQGAASAALGRAEAVAQNWVAAALRPSRLAPTGRIARFTGFGVSTA